MFFFLDLGVEGRGVLEGGRKEGLHLGSFLGGGGKRIKKEPQ